MWKSHAVKVSRCGVGWFVVTGGHGVLVVVLPGLRVAVQAAGELVERGALGGGVVVAG
jgi:hypothetical protein